MSVIMLHSYLLFKTYWLLITFQHIAKELGGHLEEKVTHIFSMVGTMLRLDSKFFLSMLPIAIINALGYSWGNSIIWEGPTK